MTNVYNEHGIRKAFHILDSTEALFELVAFTCQLQYFFLDQARK